MQTIGEVTGRLVDDSALTTEQFLDAFKQVMDTSIDLFLDGDETTWEMLANFVWAHMMKNVSVLHNVTYGIQHHTVLSQNTVNIYSFALLVFSTQYIPPPGTRIS